VGGKPRGDCVFKRRKGLRQGKEVDRKGGKGSLRPLNGVRNPGERDRNAITYKGPGRGYFEGRVSD